MRSKIAFLAASSLSVIGMVSAVQAQECTPEHEFSTVAEGYLTIAAPTFPPFSTPISATEIGGIEGAIVSEIARRECLEIRVEQVEYATAIPYVVSGRADIAIGNFYRTEERSRVVALSAPLYLDQMGILSREGLSTIAELEGKRVGTVQGYLWVTDMQNVLGSNLVLYNNYVAQFQDLEAGRIDAATEGFGVASAAKTGGALAGIEVVPAEPDERVRASATPAQAGLPLAPNNEGLLEAVDATIAAMQESGRIVEVLEEAGLPASAAEVGDPRLVR